MSAASPVPLLLETLIAYARDYETRFDRPLAEDYVLGPGWLEAARGVRVLLVGPGRFNADACDRLFLKALAVAGFSAPELDASEVSITPFTAEELRS